mgnify:CR=1 FL=1
MVNRLIRHSDIGHSYLHSQVMEQPTITRTENGTPAATLTIGDRSAIHALGPTEQVRRFGFHNPCRNRIAPQMRGQRLGERLLAAVAHHAEQSWQAGYMQLTVYQDNPRAAQFYQRLGFSTHANDTPMSARNQVFKDLLQQGRKPA